MIEVTIDGFRVKGAMQIHNATALLENGRAALAKSNPAQTITIDLALVSDTDSSALGVLFAWLRTAKQRELRLHIAHLPDTLQSLADLYGVSAALPLVA